MTNDQERAIYRLMRVPGLGMGAIERVLATWQKEPDLASAFWRQPIEEYFRRWGLPDRAARFLQDAAGAEADWSAAETDARAARGANIEMLAVLDSDYARLAETRRLPAVLFTRGNQDLLWDAGVAIPHSRGASEEALAWGACLTAALAETGQGLITGHNRDGYQRAAAAAKRAGAPVVIVLDRPLHGETAVGPRAVPVATARLWDPQFRQERELLLSDAGPREAWTPAHARRRDALIIGLASRVVAGAVRPGGIIAELCQRAALAGRPVFRSPFCQADFPATLLPLEIDAARDAVSRSQREPRGAEGSVQAQPSCLQPGWLERHWQREIAAFVAAVEQLVGGEGWVERRWATEGAAPDSLQNDVVALVLLPASGECPRVEGVVVRRPGCCTAGREKTALVLTPQAPRADLETFRAYLARCRARLGATLSSPRSST